MAVANCLTAGYSIACSTGCCSGGVNRIWIAKREDITTITRDATDAVTGITMNGPAVFYEFDFKEFTAVFNGAATQENDVNSIDQTLEWITPCMNDTLRQRYQELMNCCCGMVVIFEDLQNTTWIMGDNVDLKFGRVKFRTGTRTTGTALADQNGVTIQLGTFAAKAVVEFTLGSAGVPV
jgi:hypothetical protein